MDTTHDNLLQSFSKISTTTFNLLLNKWEGLSRIEDDFHLSSEIEQAVQFVRDSTPSTKSSIGLSLPQKVANTMAKIWADSVIKKVYDRFGERIQLLDSSE
eukprot:TRINITY_DN559_c0_g2_i1.p1 TRINITY_DN559_c0_g2~~TRINITY_DN559_c0_g2_i1.p1  ORF type:complete len:101 (-),score=4.58 TRINITY_DN559_c0_g2_i1:10-312(-)